MSSTVSLKVQVEGDQDVQRLKQALDGLNKSGAGAGRSMQPVSKSLDDVSKSSQDAGKNVQGYSKEQEKVAKSSKNAEKSNTGFGKSVQSAAGGFALAGSAAVGLWNAYDNVDDSAKKVEISENKVNQSELRLSKAREALNKLQQSGTASALDLQQAQQQVEVAEGNVERANFNLTNAQEALNEAWLQAATNIVPLLFTGISSIGTIMQSFSKTSDIATAATTASSAAMDVSATSATTAATAQTGLATTSTASATSIDTLAVSATAATGAETTLAGAAGETVTPLTAEAGAATTAAGATDALATSATAAEISISALVAPLAVIVGAAAAVGVGFALVANNAGGSKDAIAGLTNAFLDNVGASEQTKQGVNDLGYFLDQLTKTTFSTIPILNNFYKALGGQAPDTVEVLDEVHQRFVDFPPAVLRAKTAIEAKVEATNKMNAELDRLSPLVLEVAKHWQVYGNGIDATNGAGAKQIAYFQELDGQLATARKGTIDLATANGVDMWHALHMTDEELAKWLMDAQELGPTAEMQAEMEKKAAETRAKAWTDSFDKISQAQRDFASSMQGALGKMGQELGKEMEVGLSDLKKKVSKGFVGFSDQFFSEIFPEDFLADAIIEGNDPGDIATELQDLMHDVVKEGIITKPEAKGMLQPMIDYFNQDLPDDVSKPLAYMAGQLPSLLADWKPAIVNGIVSVGAAGKKAVDEHIIKPMTEGLQGLSGGASGLDFGRSFLDNIRASLPQIEQEAGPELAEMIQGLLDAKNLGVDQKVQGIIDVMDQIRPGFKDTIMGMDADADGIADIMDEKVLTPVEQMKLGILEAFQSIFEAMGKQNWAQALQNEINELDPKPVDDVAASMAGFQKQIPPTTTELSSVDDMLNFVNGSAGETTREISSVGDMLDFTSGNVNDFSGATQNADYAMTNAAEDGRVWNEATGQLEAPLNSAATATGNLTTQIGNLTAQEAALDTLYNTFNKIDPSKFGQATDMGSVLDAPFAGDEPSSMLDNLIPDLTNLPQSILDKITNTDWGGLTDGFNLLLQGKFTEAFNALGTWFTTTAGDFLSLPKAIMDKILGADWESNLVNGFNLLLQGKFTEAFTGLGTWFTQHAGDFQSLPTAILSKITGVDWSGFTNSFNLLLQGKFTEAFNTFGKWFTQNAGTFNSLPGAILTKITGVDWTGFTDSFNLLLQGKFTEAFDTFGNWFVTASFSYLNGLPGAILGKTTGADWSSMVSGLGSWIQTKFTEAFNNLGSWFAGASFSFLNDLPGAIMGKITGADWGGMMNGLTTWVQQKFTEAFQNITWDTVYNFLGLEGGGGLIDSVKGGIQSVIDYLNNTGIPSITSLLGTIGSLVQGPQTAEATPGTDTGTGTEATTPAPPPPDFTQHKSNWTDYQTAVQTAITNIDAYIDEQNTRLITYAAQVAANLGLAIGSFVTYTQAVQGQIISLGAILSAAGQNYLGYVTQVQTHLGTALGAFVAHVQAIQGQLNSLAGVLTAGGQAYLGYAGQVAAHLGTALGSFVGHAQAVGGQVNAIGQNLAKLVTGYGLLSSGIRQALALGTNAWGQHRNAVIQASSAGASASSRLQSAIASSMRGILSSVNSATSGIRSLQSAINSLHGKTIYVTTVRRTVGGGGGGGTVSAQHGFSGVVDQPTRFMTGEGNRPEFVQVTPLSEAGGRLSMNTAASNMMGKNPTQRAMGNMFQQPIIRAGGSSGKTTTDRVVILSNGTMYAIDNKGNIKVKDWKPTSDFDSGADWTDAARKKSRKFKGLKDAEVLEKTGFGKGKRDKPTKDFTALGAETFASSRALIDPLEKNPMLGGITGRGGKSLFALGLAKKGVGTDNTKAGKTLSYVVAEKRYADGSFYRRYNTGAIEFGQDLYRTGTRYLEDRDKLKKKQVKEVKYYQGGKALVTFTDGKTQKLKHDYPGPFDKEEDKKRYATAAKGFQGLVNKETQFTVGERGSEYVDVRPISEMRSSSRGGGLGGGAGANGRPIMVEEHIHNYIDGKQVSESVRKHILKGVYAMS